MLEKLIDKDLPQKYQKGFIKYAPTLDGWDGFKLKTMGIDEMKIKQMSILCNIERMKFLIQEPNDFTDDEIQYARQRINEQIEKYNSIVL